MHILRQATLLPEYRHRASDLHVTDQETRGYDHDLFSLAAVGHVALVVDAASIVASTCTLPHATRNERQLSVDTANKAIDLTKIALDEWSKPSHIDLLINEVFIQIQVPKVLVIASNQLERVRALLLHPGDAPLSRRSQIVAVREIETILQVTFHIAYNLLCLL